MISILHHGNTDRLFCVCWHCGCEFSYDEEDIRTSEGNEYIVCPDCKDEIGLDNNSFIQNGRKMRGFIQGDHWREV